MQYASRLWWGSPYPLAPRVTFLINDRVLSTEIDLYSISQMIWDLWTTYSTVFFGFLFYPLKNQTRFFTLLKIITFYSLNEQTFVECLQFAKKKKKKMVSGNWGPGPKYKLTSALKKFSLLEDKCMHESSIKGRIRSTAWKEVEAKHTGNRRIMRI